MKSELIVLIGATITCCTQYTSEESNCEKTTGTTCRGDGLFYIDSCGEEAEYIEHCENGCHPDGENCLDIHCYSQSGCLEGTYCDVLENDCRWGSCPPMCGDRCCGRDYCGGTCPDNCERYYECNQDTCHCELTVDCLKNSHCEFDELCMDMGCQTAWGRTYRITVKSYSVFRCEEEVPLDMDGSDPDLFVCFFMGPEGYPGEIESAKFCTSIVPDTCHGAWPDEPLETVIQETDVLTISLLDRDESGWELMDDSVFQGFDLAFAVTNEEGQICHETCPPHIVFEPID